MIIFVHPCIELVYDMLCFWYLTWPYLRMLNFFTKHHRILTTTIVSTVIIFIFFWNILYFKNFSMQFWIINYLPPPSLDFWILVCTKAHQNIYNYYAFQKHPKWAMYQEGIYEIIVFSQLHHLKSTTIHIKHYA